MAKLFRFRDLFMRFPVLDGWRLGLLSWISTHPAQYFTETYRVTKIYSKASQDYLKKAASNGETEPPVIYALYHGRMVGLMGLKPRKRVTILVSQSRDGEIIARACLNFGFSLARGSNKFRAFQGGRELIESARQGQSLAFTVDGPRGPRHIVKPEIIRLAEVTGLPIIPFVARARTTYWMWTWDRFMAPLWGTRIVYLFGDPILMPAVVDDEDRERLRGQVESAMSALRAQADQAISLL